MSGTAFFFDVLTSPLLQTRRDGVIIPQRRYENKGGRGLKFDNQNLVSFVREDGSYMPVTAALAGDYAGLLYRDLPGFPSETSFTITLRFEVNKFYCFR